MRAFVICAVVACGPDRSAAPPPPSPPVAPSARPVDASIAPADVAIDAAVDAPPDAPSATEIRAVPMLGPFTSALAACRSAPPCGFTKMNANGQEADPPKEPDCRFVEDGRDPDTLDDPEHMATTTKIGEVRIAGVACADPPGMRGSAARYYAYVQRADGWWRSRESLLSVSYNDKYCNAPLAAKWQRKGPHLLARVAAAITCLACGKQGDDTLVYDLIIAIDQDGAKPATYRAIPVGEHTTEKRRDDGDPTERCDRPKFDAVLAEKWPDPDTLILSGPATWHALNREAPWFSVWNGINEDEPSGVGTYRLVR